MYINDLIKILKELPEDLTIVKTNADGQHEEVSHVDLEIDKNGDVVVEIY